MTNIGFKYIVDMKLVPSRFGRVRPYVLEFQPDGCFSGFNEHSNTSIDWLAEKKISSLGLIAPPAYLDKKLQALYEIGEDKAAHLAITGRKKFGLLPKEYLAKSAMTPASQILSALGRPKDVVLKHRNMARGEGVLYVENAAINLAGVLDSVRNPSSGGKLAIFRDSNNGFVAQEGLQSIPINANGLACKIDGEATFDATLRYVIIVEVSEQKIHHVHSLAAY